MGKSCQLSLNKIFKYIFLYFLSISSVLLLVTVSEKVFFSFPQHLIARLTKRQYFSPSVRMNNSLPCIFCVNFNSFFSKDYLREVLDTQKLICCLHARHYLYWEGSNSLFLLNFGEFAMPSVRGMVSFNWSWSLAGFFSAVLLLFSPAQLNNGLERCWQCCLVTIHQRESVLHAAPSVAAQLGHFSALCHWCEQIMDHLNYCNTTPLQRDLDSSVWLSVAEVRQFGAICFTWLYKYIVK